MKRIIAFVLFFVLGVTILTGCSGSNEPFTQKDYTVDGEKVTGICIDVRDRQIEVVVSTDNQIHIKYYESSKEYYNISTSDDGVLAMATAENKGWTDYIGGKTAANYRKITLQIPVNLLTTLKLSTTNEDILLSALTVLGNVELACTGGNINFNKLDVGDTITINAKNGDISGTIIGSYDEYFITCNVKKGKSNLPAEKNDGEKTLNVSNNNGNVAISFE